jgi:hypothetical protein
VAANDSRPLRRRDFLRAATVLAFAPPVPLHARPAPTARRLACRTRAADGDLATLLDANGRVLLDVPLPARGHGFALDPAQRRAVVFARRPGDFFVVIDLRHHRVLHRVAARTDRHFYGHGVFSGDGRRLFATENAFETGAGRIGMYAAEDGFRRVGEFDSHGIGPHQVALLPDGRTLVVANGGIRTHPDMPRARLNLDTMRSALCYIDSDSGRLLAEHPAPPRWQRLSIRHLAVAPDDRVAAVMQYEGPRTDRPPLVAIHDGQGPPRWLQAPAEVQSRMRNYCGSVAFDGRGDGFSVTSPRGGLVTRWSADGEFLGSFDQVDVCGLAAVGQVTWYSDGSGRLGSRRGLAELRTARFPDSRWDNHMIGI